MSEDVVACWRCARDRYTFESCHHCGASCKPLTKAKQREDPTYKATEWWLEQLDQGGDGER